MAHSNAVTVFDVDFIAGARESLNGVAPQAIVAA